MIPLLKRFISLVATLSMTALGTMAQKATVERMEMLPMDLSASKYSRLDLNGAPCALVRVEVIADGVDFFGNVIKPVEHKMGEYWVYMVNGSKMLQIKSDTFLPVMVNFADYGIHALMPKVTYVVTLNLPSTQSPQGQTSTLTDNNPEPEDTNVYYWRFNDNNGKWGFTDTNGNIVIPATYDNAIDYCEGLAAVEIDGKWGFIDRRGNMVIPTKYDEVWIFSEGLAPVKINGKWGVINKNDNLIIPAKYIYRLDFSDGLAQIRIGDKFGFIDKNDNIVIPAKYDSARGFSEGLAAVWVNDKAGFIDKSGNMVIPAIYDNAYFFEDGEAEVELNDRTFYINKNGNEVK